jgi:hypothetical protein
VIRLDMKDDQAPLRGAERALVVFYEAFFEQAKFAMPWIGRGFYLAIGFMFAMGVVRIYSSEFIHLLQP